MRRKIFILLTALVVNSSICLGAYTGLRGSEDSSSYLKTFVQFHKVIEVFNTGSAISCINSIQSMEIQRDITQKDIELMARIVYAESKGEPFIGKVGVASVILNRLYHPDFPKSIEGIIYQKNAFSCIDNGHIYGKPDIEAYKAVDEALNGNDPTEDSVYFYNPRCSSSSWIKKYPKNSTITIGNHVFFK